MPGVLPRPAIPPGHLFCFGFGYTARRLAARLLTCGWRVSGTVRDPEAPPVADGCRLHRFDGEEPLADPGAALAGVTHVLSSVPPGAAGDPVLLTHARDLCGIRSLSWIGYLSTPAVYGDRGGAIVGEDDEPRPSSARGKRRLAAERAWLETTRGGPGAVHIFRLAGIYGPGRNVIRQVRQGTARIIEKPGQVFNRIHVDDIGSILMASMARPRPGATYNVADTEPCSSGDVVRHACALLGATAPRPVPFAEADLSDMARSFYGECKRLDTRLLREELGVTLTYPSYREGLEALLSDG